MRQDQANDDPRTGAPDVTVVIPAYNAARTLGAQLDALAAQRAPFTWEVVVADNGSTDGTRAVVAAAIGRLPRLRLVDASAKRGAGAARNAGVAMARGRSVVFCDADDVVGEGWLAAMGAALATDTFVAGRLDWARLNDPAIREARYQDGVDHLDASPDSLRLLRAGSGNLGIRTSVFRRVGGFADAPAAMEDIDFVWRVQLDGEPLVFVPQAVVHVRTRTGLRALTRQARAYGDGERWLDERYRELRAAASGSSQDQPDADSRRTAGRVLRRLGKVARQAADVRARRDVNRLLWELAFGVGYAHGPTSRTGAPALSPAVARARVATEATTREPAVAAGAVPVMPAVPAVPVMPRLAAGAAVRASTVPSW